LNIYAEYSYWWLFLTVFISVIYSLLLYYKNKKEDFDKKKLWLLSILRFLTVFIISSLLISPIIKSTSQFVKKPHIVFLQDNSESIVLTKDSSFIKNDYSENVKSLIEALKDDYNVDTYSFGEEINSNLDFAFNQKHTDISNALSQIQSKYSYQNLGALIIASDGISNLGLDPYYSAKALNIPIYSIALGDSLQQKDLLINRLIHNNLVYQNNKFPLKIDVIGRDLKDNNYNYKVYFDGKLIKESDENIDKDFYNKELNLLIEAEESGLKKLEVRLEKLDGENNTVNNSQIAYIDVIESKKRVLIAYNSPHPDIAAIKAAVNSHENYLVETVKVGDLQKNLNAYNLVIAYQIPDNSRESSAFVSKLKNSDIPYLFVLGSNVNINKFNQLQLGANIETRQRAFNEVSAVPNKNFYEFQLSEEFEKNIADFPPLLSVYGKYNQVNGLQTILYQKLGNVETEYPLISMGKYREKPIAFVFGEGLWKWRLYNYSEFKNHQIFDFLLEKVLQYLNIKEQKDRFQIQHKRKFDEDEALRFDAMLYDVAYEPITDAEINLQITDEDGDSYEFLFSYSNNRYSVNAGRLPPGKYSLIAKTQYGKDKFETKSEFIINELKLESNRLKANHNLLYRISNEHEAQMFFPSEIEKIEEEIRNNSEIVSLNYEREKFSKILDWEWLLALILFLIGLEWFIRKFSGTY